ncbi:Clan CA, family C2, calpain-like cysteine peptidase [Trichomonas vaginalis G3]|uniref:Clan CA, family C2, calpain-like cysteine peptidase n=1 Tax=Trichomonas vaginalis (strain ATCC PRA-98 / G3) TaxID=412133 RepID=A2FHB3_TRIV3|nr:calcium-dependent cysteine-type endopeptidase protein [Trichomonas vaginalis G3]EAX95710.1 Clan CA, family C2, calpain-like cysteine peptidase [Trichomonas vaginalis G3]KAI5491203.1 calcium-dependent cysteine-type endopeptidase protein [Trichomonas vaginalis G3]|eukprot:XP_001308640.1 Clan CA, family C2, calpain-like cysteine peptidase [Trichomonas vaginalis G3]
MVDYVLNFDWEGYKVYGLAFAIALVVVFIIWSILISKVFEWHPFLIARYEIANRIHKERNAGVTTFLSILWWIFFSLPFLISIAWGVITAIKFKPVTFGISIAAGLPALLFLLYGFQNYKASGYRLSPAVRYSLVIAFILLAGSYVAVVYTFSPRNWMGEGYLLLWPPLLFYAFAIVRCRRKFKYMALPQIYSSEEKKVDFIKDLEADKFDEWLSGRGYMTWPWAVLIFFVSLIFNGLFVFLWRLKKVAQYKQAALGTGVASFIIDFLILLSEFTVTDNTRTIHLLFIGYIIKVIIVSFSDKYWYIGHGFLFLILATYYICRFINWLLLLISKAMRHHVPSGDMSKISKPCQDLLGKMNPEYKKPKTSEAVLTLISLLLICAGAGFELGFFKTGDLKELPFGMSQKDGYIAIVIFTIVLGLAIGGLVSVKKDNFKCKWPMSVVFIAGIILGAVFFYTFNPLKEHKDLRILFFLVYYYLMGTIMVAFCYIGNDTTFKGKGWGSLQTISLLFYCLCLLADAVCLVAIPYVYKDETVEYLGLVIFLTLTALYLFAGFCFSYLKEECWNCTAFLLLIFYLIALVGLAFSGYKDALVGTIPLAAVILILSCFIFAIAWTARKGWRFDVGPTVIVCVVSGLLTILAIVWYAYKNDLDMLCLVVGLVMSTLFFAAITYHLIQKNEYKATWGVILSFILMIICIIIDVVGVAYTTKNAFAVISVICAILTLISYVGIGGFVLTANSTNAITYTDIFLPVRRLFNGELTNMGFIRTFAIIGFVAPWFWGLIACSFFKWYYFGSLGTSAAFAVMLFMAFALMYNVDSMSFNAIEHMEYKPIEFAVNKAITISGCDVDEDLVVPKDESTYEKFMAYVKSRVQLFKDRNEFEAALKAQLYITSEMQFLSDLEKARKFVEKNQLDVPFLQQTYFSTQEKKLIMKFIDAVENNDRALENKEDGDYDEYVRKQEKARAKKLINFLKEGKTQLGEYGKLIKEAMSGNTKYADPVFHPLKPVAETNGRCLQNVEWKRAEDEFKEAPTGHVNANDLCQGALGDCYLVSAMAAICAAPHDVVDIFEDHTKIQKTGAACISFYSMGKRGHVIVDTQLPFSTKSGKGKFVHPRDPETNGWWFTLVEKAYAKQNGSYSAIEGGNSHLALYRLVGGWPEIFNLDSLEMKERINNGTLWKRILQWHQDKDYICCGSHPGSDTTKSKTNIVQGHAYSVLQAVEVKGFQLLQLRNPWGDSEWNGDWSDKSPLWTKHPDIAKQLGHTDVDDGMFWITFKDFCANYSTLYVTLRLKNWHTVEFFGKFNPGPTDGAKPVSTAPPADNVTQYTVKFSKGCKVKVMFEKIGPNVPTWLYAVYNKGEAVKKIFKGMPYFTEAIAPSSLVESFEFEIPDSQTQYPWTIFPVRNKADKPHDFMMKVFATEPIESSGELKPNGSGGGAAGGAQASAPAAAKDNVKQSHGKDSSSDESLSSVDSSDQVQEVEKAEEKKQNNARDEDAKPKVAEKPKKVEEKPKKAEEKPKKKKEGKKEKKDEKKNDSDEYYSSYYYSDSYY